MIQIFSCFLLLNLVFWSFQSSAQTVVPDLTLRTQISRTHHQSYITLPFVIPPGVERLSFEAQYTQREQKTVVDLGLLDSQGHLVGWSGGNKDKVTLSAIDATPSYSPHPIDPGEWKILLGIPNIRSGVVADVEVKIYFSSSKISTLAPRWVNPILNKNAGWYRGDLHLHSAHSDGSCQNSNHNREIPCPIFLIAQKARDLKLDFIALSEHNATSQAQSIRELQDYFDPLLLMPSRELTSFYGHANLLGSMDEFDFRATSPTESWREALGAKRPNAYPTFLSINHPNFPSGELCMGCGWTFDPSILDSGLIQGIEVANGDDVGQVYSGLPFWLDQLEKGRRLTAVAGSDNHHVDQSERQRSYLGRPTNVVYAENLSLQAITEALIQGHNFIDFANANDTAPKREVEFTLSAGERKFMMGDPIKLLPHEQSVKLHVTLKNAQGSQAHLHISPNMQIPTELGQISEAVFSRSLEFTPPKGHHWIFLEIRDAQGRLNLMTNPIYIDR
jgi:hypothetical protein